MNYIWQGSKKKYDIGQDRITEKGKKKKKYIYIYKYKLKRSIYCCHVPIEWYQWTHHPLYNSFFYLVNFLTYCYTFSNFSSLFYLFITPLLSTLLSLFHYQFIFLYFLIFLFSSSYYKFTILFFILFIIFFLHTKGSLSLSLSHTHTHTHTFFSSFLVDFIIFFLHFYFNLMNFCIIWNSTLGWCD